MSAYPHILNKVSSDVDSISVKLIKQIITCVANPFTHICNVSFRTGVFPDKMKIAKVVPLFKSGDKYIICNNYRPISLLLQFFSAHAWTNLSTVVSY